jgi:hypothetical protein
MGMGSVLCKVNPYDEDISKTRDLGWYPRMDLEMSPTYDHHSHSHLLILCPSLPLLRNSWNSYNIPSLFYSWSDIHGYKLFLQIPQEISPMMCVCVCVCVCESGLVSGQGLWSIGVKRGPTQRLCLFSGSFVKSTSDHHLFFGQCFCLNWNEPRRPTFLLIVIVIIFTNLQSWIILIN